MPRDVQHIHINNIQQTVTHRFLLTQEQTQAVEWGKGPLLVVAGAGTGKTSVIAHRVARLIREKIARMDEILVLTFSEKAAQEMEERIDMLVPYSFSDIWVSTFHSFGDKILSAHAHDIGLSPNYRILTAEEMTLFLMENLFNLPLNHFRPIGNPYKYLSLLSKLISRLKEEIISPEEYMAYVQTIPTGGDPVMEEKKAIHKELAEVYQKVRDLMYQKGLVDFGDLVYLPLLILKNHPLIADYYIKKFKYILLDEFQDTNYCQYEMVKILSQGEQNLTVVGDDDQSIYKFRGAAISNILNFMKDFPKARQVVLSINFRSPQKILDSAYKLITHNNPHRLEVRNNVNKQLMGREDAQSVLTYRIFDTQESMAVGIGDIIQKKLEEEYSLSDMAILIRNNRDADYIIPELNLREIPFTFSGSKGLFLRPEVRILINFLRILSHPSDSLSLYYLAGSPVYKLSPETLARCSLYSDHFNFSLWEVFKKISVMDGLKNLPVRDQKIIDKIIQDLEKFVNLSTQITSGRLLYEFLRHTGYLAEISRIGSNESALRVQNIALFFDIIKKFEQISPHPFAHALGIYIRNLIDSGEDPPSAQAEQDQDSVSIMTIHKAKGLEFPIVIISGLAEGNFPSRQRHDTLEIPHELLKDTLTIPDYHIQEERRLFYVAMTRSKKELYLLGAEHLGGKRKKKISRFLEESLDINLKNVLITRLSAQERIKSFSGTQGKKSIDPSPPSYGITDLTSYHIDDYLTCPLKYRYIHILKIPVLRHHTVVFGQAVRNAVSEFLKNKQTNQRWGKDVGVELLMEQFNQNWTSEGFLSREHEEMSYKKGESILREFYQSYSKEDISEFIIDKKFRFFVDNVRIWGRWDILKTEKEEGVIVDFRTGSPGSPENARRKVRSSIRNRVSLLAYHRIYQRLPLYMESRFIDGGLVVRIKPTEELLVQTEEDIKTAYNGISAGNWTAQPELNKCLVCPYSEICPAREMDF